MDLETGLDLNRGPLVRSHFRDELHCVCAHPLRQVGGPSQHLPTHTFSYHTPPLLTFSYRRALPIRTLSYTRSRAHPSHI